ncbi:hypothetical protein SAMN04488112_11426 [Melghirimyces thermohalophilus]|uniref:Uncharacterized protein n=1 Tax=Melghirimyces thermohalophilus TaxID=1236220 RepID=A0A1G6NSW1_9BACL|nr:hypothetical protein [Melghirimyces thermohalophilus]SDC71023.1 hypothetical protein SAMN04488112_11426 [Melghirimyces thermohalophilus]
MAETAGGRFQKMEKYLIGLLQELQALEAEFPEYRYEIDSINMKTHEVQRNIKQLRRRMGPPKQNEESTERQSAGEMAREIHRVLTQCKVYMEQMEQADPSFAESRMEIDELLDRARDRLQHYWEGEKTERPSESAAPRLQEETVGPQIPAFMMQKRWGKA